MTTPTPTPTLSIDAGSLVAADSSPEAALYSVLPAFYLDDDSRSTELSQAGWRLAESFNGTGQRIFVRPLHQTGGGVPRWLSRWSKQVVTVEVRDVETGVVETEAGFALVARLGPARSARSFTPFITPADNVVPL